MPTICLMEFDKQKNKFCYFKEIEVLAVPRTNEKIMINIDDIDYMFLVQDVIYSERQKVDVLIIRISNVTEYYSKNLSIII